MSDHELQVSVSSPEEAEQLRQDFDEILARVNGDMMGRYLHAADPLSVEREILQAEQSIDFHLRDFASNAALQQLGPEIKLRFRRELEQQALAAQQRP